MNTKIRIALVLVALVIVALIILFFRGASTQPGQVIIPEADPIDVVLDFYDSWLSLVTDTETDQYNSELFSSSILSSAARAAIIDARKSSVDFDPITCQTDKVPERFRGRAFPASETEVRLLIESRIERETLPYMSFVTVGAVNGMWQITEIECTQGDVAEEVEFNYNREGLLLKSVPPPFVAGQWHLVFEQDGQMGHVTPLFFSATTTCVNTEGQESICNPDSFTETTRVTVKGGMTETGAEVSRIEFIQ